MRLTEEDIERARTPKGGWTRKQLAAWGVSWPPPKGWRRALTGKASWSRAKAEPPPRDLNTMLAKDETAAQLLRKVVVAIINKGHADDLYEFPDVLDYFGARIPDENEISPEAALDEEYRQIIG